MKRKNIAISILVLTLIFVFIYFSNYAEEEKTEEKPLYFILSIEKSDNIPYRFESNNTVFVIEKDKIICYGGIEAVGNDINVSLPKDYEWGENDYFAITLKYDSKFIERYFSEPKEQRGQGYYQNLRFILEKSYIMSDFTDSKNYPYYLDADKIANNNQILLKPLVSYFKEKHPEHRVFSIKYYLRFSLEYFDDEFQKWVSLAPISNGDHIYLWTWKNVHLRRIEVSQDLLIVDIQPDPPERFPRHVLYQTRYGEKEYINFHMVIGEPLSWLEERNVWFNSHFGILFTIFGAIVGISSLYSLWRKIKSPSQDSNSTKGKQDWIYLVTIIALASIVYYLFYHSERIDFSTFLNLVLITALVIVTSYYAKIIKDQHILMKRATELPIFIDLFKEFRSNEFKEYLRYIYNELDKKCDPTKGFMGLPKNAKKQVTSVSQFFETLGQLVAHNIIDEDLVIGYMGGSILNVWKVLEKYIYQERKIRKEMGIGEEYQEFFEDLVVRIKEKPPAEIIKRLKLKKIKRIETDGKKGGINDRKK